MSNDQSLIVASILCIDRQLYVFLPDVELVRDADERLEVADLTLRVLLSKIDILNDSLLPLTVLVESHHCNASILTNRHLDIDPLIERQEYWV